MSFRITGLDPSLYQGLHALSAADLDARGIERVRVESKSAAPCRITLDDAEIGETVLLLSYAHQQADTPYRQQGPIFVRDASARCDVIDAIPPALARRVLSLRGYDAGGSMIEADLTEGGETATLIERFFDNKDVAYIHAHYARRGCYAALITRA